MSDFIVSIFDGNTGETIERQMTNDEIADLQAQQLENENFQAQRDAKIAARESALAKLAALGLTQEEIDAL